MKASNVWQPTGAPLNRSLAAGHWITLPGASGSLTSWLDFMTLWVFRFGVVILQLPLLKNPQTRLS